MIILDLRSQRHLPLPLIPLMLNFDLKALGQTDCGVNNIHTEVLYCGHRLDLVIPKPGSYSIKGAHLFNCWFQRLRFAAVYP